MVRTAENDPEKLENIADDVHVASGEDEEDGACEGDAGRTGVLPLLLVKIMTSKLCGGTYAKEPVEHGVVVWQSVSSYTSEKRGCNCGCLRVKGWPVAAGRSGVRRPSARSRNSD